MCKCTPEIRTPFCGKPGCEDEYFNIKKGNVKVYIHKQQYIITENGDTLLLRFSYDKQICFVRSICLVEPCIDLDGSIKMKKIPLNLNLSVTEEERRLLGDEEIK